jgi:hypothetical protein
MGTSEQVGAAIQRHFGLHRRALVTLMRGGLFDVGLTLEEWEEFLRICGEAGVPKSAELKMFESTMHLLDRHGDDGYGDKPAEMSRIVYWFQHVPPPAADARSRSPRRRARRP